MHIQRSKVGRRQNKFGGKSKKGEFCRTRRTRFFQLCISYWVHTAQIPTWMGSFAGINQFSERKPIHMSVYTHKHFWYSRQFLFPLLTQDFFDDLNLLLKNNCRKENTLVYVYPRTFDLHIWHTISVKMKRLDYS